MQQLLLLLLCSHRVLGYNIDVQFPIVYSDPDDVYNRSTYFGFSVILQANSDISAKNWIQIGAPRGNYDKHIGPIEPGVVFRCLVGQPCKKIPLNFYYYGKDDDDRKEAWIGGAMDVQAPEQGGRSVICGHRWARNTWNTTRREILFRDMVGLCYWMHEDYGVNVPLEQEGQEDVDIILPLNNKDERLYRIKDGVTAYKWGVGQMGTSVHFPLDTEDQMLIGAPGILNWQGNAVHCKSDREVSGGGNEKRSVRLDEFGICAQESILYNKLESFYYMGYAVNSGRFFKRDGLVYVTGGPKAEKLRGMVLLYTLPFKRSQRTNVVEKAVGSTMGEFFGASLAVGDFTGDGLDDLAVGAPHYSRNHDEGCVYLYYGSEKQNLIRGSGNEEKIIGKSSGARFGTTLAALGDIDQDGFGDLAVGAPYENDNRGAIYIFNGALDGLNSEYSQRIGAEDFSPYLRGFGISIARPADIDDNKYTDVAVGSYISGHTVLLRGRPIVVLSHSPLYTKDKRVERNATQFVIRVCSQYTGSNVPTQLVILRTLVVDEGFKRAFIRGPTFKQRQQNFTSNVTLYAGADQCDDVEIHIHKDKIYLTDPIEIKIFQELSEKDADHGAIIWVNRTTTDYAKDRFCKTCPILSRKNAHIENTLVVKFDLECGADDVCDARLVLDCHFLSVGKSSTYKLGSNRNTLALYMEVTNQGELAYSTQLEVLIPKPVHLFRIPINCQINAMANSTAIKCAVANPLTQEVKSNLTLELDMSAVKGESGQLDFTVAARTLSNDLNAADNIRHLALTVVTDANMTIAGKSINDTYSYVELNANSSSKSVYFYHVYQVQKQGASPVEEALIEILVPTSIWNQDRTKQVNFLGMYEPEGKINDAEVQCTSDYVNKWNYLNDEKPDEFSDDANVEVERVRRATTDDVAVGGAKYLLPANRTMFLNCSDGGGVVCSRVRCKAGRFVGNAVARVKIRMVLNITVLEPLMGKKDIILFNSMGSVNIIDNIIDKRPANAGVYTTFLGSVSDKEVNDWVIPVSIGIGLLLLFLTIMLLIKTGFFERKKKAQLQALISAENQADVLEPSPQNEQSNQEAFNKSTECLEIVE